MKAFKITYEYLWKIFFLSLYKQLNDAAKTLINSKASTNRYLHVLCIDLWLQQIINSFFKAFISLNICCGNINIPMQYMYFCFHLIIQTYSFCKKKNEEYIKRANGNIRIFINLLSNIKLFYCKAFKFREPACIISKIRFTSLYHLRLWSYTKYNCS